MKATFSVSLGFQDTLDFQVVTSQLKKCRGYAIFFLYLLHEFYFCVWDRCDCMLSGLNFTSKCKCLNCVLFSCNLNFHVNVYTFLEIDYGYVGSPNNIVHGWFWILCLVKDVHNWNVMLQNETAFVNEAGKSSFQFMINALFYWLTYWAFKFFFLMWNWSMWNQGPSSDSLY